MLTLTYVLLWLALVAYVVHVATERRWAGWGATGLTVVAWGLLTAGLVRRGLAAGHWPLANRYEFALCFVWAIVTVYLLLEASWRERRTGAFVLAVALLVATYAVTRSSAEKGLMPLPPALRSVWLQVHVLTVMVGYAAFAVAAGLGVMRLVQRTAPSLVEGSGEGTPSLTGGGGGGKTPPLTGGGGGGKTPPLVGGAGGGMERAVALGFPWLTLGILTGAIWAQNAWGRYWGWDPKETWALITWLWYLLFLHVRPLRSWRGKRLAWLAIAGFGLVLFTFIGVPWLVRTVRLESLHGY